MIHITLDTCVWLDLLQRDLHTNNSEFDEICFWIENKHIIHITPQNILREWDRNKVNKTLEIVKKVDNINKGYGNLLKNNSALSSIYQPNVVEGIITQRVEKVEYILKTTSEIAHENQEIYNEATNRALDCLAPNHNKESFRDTINLLSIINHLKTKDFPECIFSTINYTDFSQDKSKKYDLHLYLQDIFTKSNLQYVFFDEENTGSKLFNVFLRPKLPSFNEYLKEKESKEEAVKLEEKKAIPDLKIDDPDKDFIENVKLIDLILLNKKPTLYQCEVLSKLIHGHPSYEQYFLRHVGNK